MSDQIESKIDKLQREVHEMRLDLVSRWAETQSETNAAAEKIRLYLDAVERNDRTLRSVQDAMVVEQRRLDRAHSRVDQVEHELRTIAGARLHWSRWLGQIVGGTLLVAILGLLIQQT